MNRWDKIFRYRSYLGESSRVFQYQIGAMIIALICSYLMYTGLRVWLTLIFSCSIIFGREIYDFQQSVTLLQTKKFRELFTKILILVQVRKEIQNIILNSLNRLQYQNRIQMPFVNIYWSDKYKAGQILVELNSYSSDIIGSNGFVDRISTSLSLVNRHINVVGTKEDINYQFISFFIKDSRTDEQIRLSHPYFRLEDNLQIPLTTELFWDLRKAPHLVVSGRTGAGKTYFILYLLAVMRTNAWKIFVIDPKQSELSLVNEKNVASTKEEILNLFAEIRQTLNKRKNENQRKIAKSNQTFSDFGFQPIAIILDELAALLAVCDKKEQGYIFELLKQVAFMGRSLGIFLIIGVQQANATVLPTAIREQMSLKILLGNTDSDSQKFLFGDNTVKLTSEEVGSGLISINGNGPGIFQAPQYDFDILTYLQT